MIGSWKASLRAAVGAFAIASAVAGVGFSVSGASATTCCLPPPPPPGGETQPPPIVIGGTGTEQGTENEGDQWIAKQYTELLGRTPTVSEWQSAESQVLGVKLLMSNQETVDKSIVDSAEFAGLGYSNQEKAVVLYRAILDRDPDSTGFTNLVNIIANPSQGLDAAVHELYFGATTAEAQEVNGEASQAGPYYWGNSYHHFDPNSTTAYSHVSSGHFAGGTAAQLQAALSGTPSGGTLYLDEGAVVTADAPITIPAGVTLATFGVTNRNAYAKMGRIIRTASFTNPVITVQSTTQAGARLNYVWIDGNRPAFMTAPAINPLWYDWTATYPADTASCGTTGGSSYPGPNIRDCMKNISVVGDNAQVTNSRIQDPLGSTNMKIEPGHSNETISGNLITSYATSHFLGEVSNNGNYGLWADGITFDGSSSTISSNQIVDATDVAIVLIGSSGTNDNVFSNTDLQAGNSAYGGFVFDPFKCPTPTTCQTYSFSGSSIHDNTFWTGWYAHYVVALSVGTRAWFGQNTGSPATSGNLASNASMVNNTVPTGVKIRTGIGVGVDGATSSTATGNNLNRTVSVFSSAFVGWIGGACTNPGNTPAVISNDNADSTLNTVSDPTGATVANMALHTTRCTDVQGMTKKESVAIY